MKFDSYLLALDHGDKVNWQVLTFITLINNDTKWNVKFELLNVLLLSNYLDKWLLTLKALNLLTWLKA